MKAVCVLLFACAAGIAAAKQVTLSPPTVASSPPPPVPPAVPVTTFQTPGFVWSFLVPGVTTFPASAQTAFCNVVSSALTSPVLPSGYNTSCSVVSTAPFNGTATTVNGFAFTTWAAIPSITQINTAVALRDAAILTLTTNSSSIFSSSFPGTVPVTACSGVAAVTALSNAELIYSTNVTSPGPVQCANRLTFASPNAVALQVGIDSGVTTAANKGKFCSTPAVVGGVVGVPGSGSCVPYGVLASSAGTSSARAEITATEVVNGAIVLGNLPAANLLSPGSGYTSAPTVTISAPSPIPATIPITVATAGATPGAISTTISPTENGPYAGVTATVATVTGAQCISVAGAKPCSGDSITITTGATRTTGPRCLPSDFNDAANGGVSANALGVNAAGTLNAASWTNIRCDTSNPAPVITLASTFQPLVTATAIATIELNPAAATYGEVTAITIVSGGSGYPTTTTASLLPTVTIAPPNTNNIGKLCSPTPISGLAGSIAVSLPVSPISTSTACQPLGLNTITNRVCSAPAVAGGEWLPINTYTCNVQNSFIPQPGSTTTSRFAVVPQTFTTTATAGTSPSPAPTPSPGTTSAPPPTAPPPASYRGRFQIASVACPGKFLAASANCGDRLVYLRTTSQSKGSRTFWVIDGTAGVATGVASVVRVGKCNGNTNLASAQSTPTPVIGGGSWKVVITPVDAKNPSVVTIQATDKTYKGKFLQIGDKCDDQKGFSWADKSSSTGQQWTITSVSNLQ